MKKVTLILVFLIVTIIEAYSQPCMDKWHFRIPITIDNTSNPNALVDFQYKITIATDSLIQNGDLKADASDLRITK